MNFIFFGDIHGRTNWKEFSKIDDNTTLVFLGDYFDPYSLTSGHECISNLNDIFELKRMYPNNVILLLGNHDYHYLTKKECYSRFDAEMSKNYNRFLTDNIELFYGISFAADDKVIATHAGISDDWLKIRNYTGDFSTKDVSDFINKLFFQGFTKDIKFDWDGLKYFSFDNCGTSFDMYGTTSTQSPIWIRPETLQYHNPFDDSIYQIFGHSQSRNIEKDKNFWMVDCLGYANEVLMYENGNFTVFKGI